MPVIPFDCQEGLEYPPEQTPELGVVQLLGPPLPATMLALSLVLEIELHPVAPALAQESFHTISGM
jgi:hypothetical protein